MSEIKVSVIVPIYNAQRFLEETLGYITGQSLKEIEIICVDDGSTDASLEILEAWKQRDDRIRILHQQNLYAGSARNRGIEEAAGRYLVFWDADDIFDARALEIMYLQLERTEADLCVCAARKYDDQTGKSFEYDTFLKKQYLPDKEVFHKGDMADHLFEFATNNPWNKMFRKSYVEEKGLRFMNLRQANDAYFVMMSLFLAERITYVTDNLIGYRINLTTSITGSSSAEPRCICRAYLHTAEEMQKYPEYQAVKRGFLNHAMGSFFSVLNNQKQFEKYCLLYEELSSNTFRELGLTEMAADQFTEKWVYEDLQRMLTVSPGDFLLQKGYVRMINTQKERSAKQYYQKKYTELDELMNHPLRCFKTACRRKYKKWKGKN